MRVKLTKAKKGYFNESKLIRSLRANKKYYIFTLYLSIVIIITYFLPLLIFGKPYGTDTYTHLFHTIEMYDTNSLYSFYEEIGNIVFNPELDNNPYNYPFGSWLFIAALAKITGLKPLLTAYIFTLLYLLVTLSTYYMFCSLFLKQNVERIFALLFLLSMPITILAIETFRPSTFVFPFLIIVIYFCYLDDWNLRNLMIILLSEAIIAVSHTGTYICLMSLLIIYFSLNCLISGKFSKSTYFALASSYFLYWITIKLFPHLLPQYAAKSSLFVTPGNFIANKLHIFFADDLSYILYQNMFVNHEFTYAIICSALFFGLGLFLLRINKLILKKYNYLKSSKNFAFLPTSIPHSIISTPFWIGIIQTALALIGFFRLDSKGKIFTISLILITIFPAWLNESSGSIGSTGALREIEYLRLIIPIIAALGLSQAYKTLRHKKTSGKILFSVLITVIFLSFIIPPLVGNELYNSKISCEDHITDGMTWLSETGNEYEKVAGYGYRTTPIFTGKIDSSYGLAHGTQSKNYVDILKEVYIFGSGNQAMTQNSLFGTKYYLLSEKLLSNLKLNMDDVKIDYNSDLDRIYSSKDLGIYGLFLPSDKDNNLQNTTQNSFIKDLGTNFEITTDSYKIQLSKYSPTIRYIGDKYQNYLMEGTVSEKLKFSFISKTEIKSEAFSFNLEDGYTVKHSGNQIIYTTTIKNKNSINISSAEVRYTFYPELLKREYYIYNDYINTNDKVSMGTYFTTQFFSPFLKIAYYGENKRNEKKIYPSEDIVNVESIYNKIYIHNDDDSGIYIDYEDTSPPPSNLFYKGSTTYEYSTIGTKQYHTIEPGASFHITQLISIGNENTAKNAIDRQKRVSLHLYPKGITPLAFCEYNSGTYLSGPGKNKKILIGNRYIEVTKTEGTNDKGLNLEILKQYSEAETPYITSIKINPPYLNILNKEGLRHPQIAKIEGIDTEIVILPVSKPLGEIKNNLNSNTEFFEEWKNVIKSVSENNDMALFLISDNDILNLNSKKFENFLEYVNTSGLTFISPDEIASHYKLINNIEYSSKQSVDKIELNVINNNKCEIYGLTFRIKMPLLDKGNYIVNSGNIIKTKIEDNQKVIYISIDMKEKEERSINIYPDIVKEKIIVDIPEYPTEGKNQILVKDKSGNIIKNATIIIDSSLYYPDVSEPIYPYLRRGLHNLKVEKAGHITYNSNFEVHNRIYNIINFF